MSAGNFIISKYEADDGEIHPIRIQPETIIATTNPAPTGATTSSIRARVGGSRRSYGLHARTIRVTWTVPATHPDGYKDGGTMTIPVLGAAAFAAINVGSTFTYLGSGVTVTGKSPEVVR